MNKILKGIVKALPIIGVMIFLIAILIIFGAVPRSYYLNSFDGFSVIEGETNMGFEAKLKIAISQRDTAQYKYDKSKTALDEGNKEKKNAETDFMLAQERLRLATTNLDDIKVEVDNNKIKLDERVMRVKILEEESKSQ